MHDKLSIAIIGIGGVGGYLGAKLAAHYENAAEVDVFFIVRGENEKAILANGLKLIMPEQTIIARPRKLSADPTAIGRVDMIICCVKSYHLESSIRALIPCIDADTLILPLLNGVDAKERINKILPGIPVLEGCIYLVSRLIAPGVVEKRGNVQQVYFGSSQHPLSKLKQVETIFKDAGIDATVLTDIGNKCWEKFFFISTIATLTLYLNKTIGEIIANEGYRQQLLSLMKEFQAVAEKKSISLPENIVDKSIDTLSSLPYDATSSMHTDFKKGNQTEVKSITGYVVLLGKELGVAMPVYEEMLTFLLKSK
jgi:2-dehydropantoate 2-reductase